MARTRAELEAEVDAIAEELERLASVDDGNDYLPDEEVKRLKARLESVIAEAPSDVSARLQAVIPMFNLDDCRN